MKLLDRLSLKQFSLGVREKVGILVLVQFVVGVWGFGSLVVPRIERFAEARVELVETRETLLQLEAERPDLDAFRAHISTLQGEVSKSYQGLEELEQGLLYRQDVDLLLERLVVDRKKLDLTINAIKPVREKPTRRTSARQAEGSRSEYYKGFLINVNLFAAFDNLIAYLEVLEDQGPYQRVRGVHVKMDRKGKRLPQTSILLETLLADLPEQKAEHRRKVISLLEDVSVREQKDPFLTRERPLEEQLLAGMTLSGIFGEGSNLSALIDGEVYSVGDEIQGKQVVEILPDRVILEGGNQRYLLVEQRGNP